MADRYIDYLEVGEYGDHFVSEVTKLVGLTSLVDIKALHDRVEAAVAKVDAELGKVGIKRSDVRTGRDETQAASDAGKDLIGRFYYHLLSLPKTAGIDVEAFYPGKNLGNLSELKPADVKGRLASLLRGFAAPANAAAPQVFGTWNADLTAADGNLATALADKGSARGQSITGTAELVASREDFLRIYNKVAKRLVAGVLAELGREGEYELFFKDLTVNEGGKGAKKVEEPPGTAAPAAPAAPAPAAPAAPAPAGP